MQKFKAGDKVIRLTSSNRLTINYVYRIERLGSIDNDIFIIDDNNEINLFKAQYFMLARKKSHLPNWLGKAKGIG